VTFAANLLNSGAKGVKMAEISKYFVPLKMMHREKEKARNRELKRQRRRLRKLAKGK